MLQGGKPGTNVGTIVIFCVYSYRTVDFKSLKHLNLGRENARWYFWFLLHAFYYKMHDDLPVPLCTRNNVVLWSILKGRSLSQTKFFLNVILDHKLNSSFFFSRFIATFLFS